MKKIFYLMLLFTFAAVPSMATGSKIVPGDVLVIFTNPFPDSPVTLESLAQGSETGKHRAYVESVAESLDAKVAYIYETLSVKNNNIMALLHSDTKSEHTLQMKLKMRKDVKGASLNYIKNIDVKPHRKTFAR